MPLNQKPVTLKQKLVTLNEKPVPLNENLVPLEFVAMASDHFHQNNYFIIQKLTVQKTSLKRCAPQLIGQRPAFLNLT